MIHPVHAGTISARPLEETHGRIAAKPEHGRLDAGRRCQGKGENEPAESAQSSASAELSSLISSLGSLSAQAQGLPLTPPTLPGLPQSNGYQPQATDYTQLADDAS